MSVESGGGTGGSGGAGLVARGLHYLLWLQLIFALCIGWWVYDWGYDWVYDYLYAHFSGTASGVMHWLAAVVLSGVAGLSGVLLLRIIITAHNFYLAARVASPSPVKLTFRQSLRLFFAEFLSTLYSSSWGMHRRTFALGWGGESQTLPVLLIHGYICNSGYWHPCSKVLKRAKVRHFALDLEPVFGSIEAYVPLVRRAVEAICAQTGSEKLIIVGHSMGGLVARAYLREHGSAGIAQVITLGTPHNGTNLAKRGPGVNARQMEWTPKAGGKMSAWLSELNASENAAAKALITSIFSYHDNIVSPQLSSQVAGGRNIPLAGIGHVELAFNPLVQQCLLHEIERVSTQI